jgi:hypothetical protein
MSSIGLHWSAAGLLSVVLAIALPGLLIGGLIGIMAWPAHRAAGASLGGIAGMLIAVLVTTLFGVQLPMGF